MDTLKLDLTYPLTLADGRTLKTLTIRRPKAKDIRKMTGKTEAEQSLSLLALLTDLVPEDIDEMDLSDFTRAAEAVAKMTQGKSV